MGDLEDLMEKHDTYESLLAAIVDEIKEFNTGQNKTKYAQVLGASSIAFFVEMYPKNETGDMPDDITQCFYFALIVAIVKGYLPNDKPLRYFRSKRRKKLDEHNILTAKKGAEELRNARHFHSFLMFTEAAGIVNQYPNRFIDSLNGLYRNTEAIGWARDFKYKDHPSIEKVLGNGYSTQGA